ncbi:MAG: hypothetical protein HUU17_09695, partial [Chthonomonadales bacterium]|nr:hypothetical protein [Chthonomonadales bacterium]
MRTGLHRTGMALIAMLALTAASTSVQALPAVQLWGWNGYGELGDGTTYTRYWATPISTWPIDTVAMAGGGYHVLAVGAGGAVVSCGYNAYGQLGDGSTTHRTSPVNVTGITTAVSAAAGQHHSVARLSDGTVRCWGYNGVGSLGDGTYTNANTPVQVLTAALAPLDDVVGVAAGGYFSLAVRSDGTVWAWGDNTNGQLGDGTTTSSNVAVQVSGITTAIAVAAGQYHSLALLSDGRVMAWGYNGYSQLGDGTATDRLTPVYVLDAPGGGHFPDVGAIAAGAWHSVFRMTDGTVWCAGDGSYGQIGNGDWATQTTPVQVPGFVAAAGQSIAAGYAHTLAIASDGKCWAWGSGSYGELGDGLGTASNTPVQTYGLSGATHIASGSSSWASFAIAETTRAATSLFTLDRTATVTEVMALRAYLKRVDTSAWIPGETVDFYIDGTWVGNGVTNGSGRADFLWTVYVGPASRTILASFLEVDDYFASSDTATATCLVWATKLGTFDRTQRIARRTELKARL